MWSESRKKINEVEEKCWAGWNIMYCYQKWHSDSPFLKFAVYEIFYFLCSKSLGKKWSWRKKLGSTGEERSPNFPMRCIGTRTLYNVSDTSTDVHSATIYTFVLYDTVLGLSPGMPIFKALRWPCAVDGATSLQETMSIFGWLLLCFLQFCNIHRLDTWFVNA